MKRIIAIIAVLAVIGSFAVSCSSSSGPEAVFKQMGNIMDDLISVLEKNQNDPAAAAKAVQGFLDKNGAKLKALALKAKKIGEDVRKDPEKAKELMVHAFSLMGKATKLSKLTSKLSGNADFRKVWNKYRKASQGK